MTNQLKHLVVWNASMPWPSTAHFTDGTHKYMMQFSFLIHLQNFLQLFLTILVPRNYCTLCFAMGYKMFNFSIRIATKTKTPQFCCDTKMPLVTFQLSKIKVNTISGLPDVTVLTDIAFARKNIDSNILSDLTTKSTFPPLLVWCLFGQLLNVVLNCFCIFFHRKVLHPKQVILLPVKIFRQNV